MVFDSGVALQPRDFSVLRNLFEARVMTSNHIATLHFDGSREAAKKRLQKLKAAGLIRERKRGITDFSVLFLTLQSFRLLKSEGMLNEYPPFSLTSLERRSQVSDLTIRHELAVMDVKVAFHSAARKSGALSVAHSCTWPLLNQFEAFSDEYGGAQVLVKPDGFLRIHETEASGEKYEHAFFVELDRSTETLDTLVSRAACYVNFYSSGGFAVRNGATPDQYKEYPFRVLYVMKTQERRNNTAEQLLQGRTPIFNQVCLSTLEEVTADPFGPIWITPARYRDATAGTPFDPSRQQNGFGYRSRAEREKFVEGQIKKMALLNG